MFPELCAALGWEGQVKDALIVVDAALDLRVDFFVINHLSVALRSGGAVCLLALQHTLTHYQAIARKAGVNLGSALSSGQLTVIDLATLGPKASLSPEGFLAEVKARCAKAEAKAREKGAASPAVASPASSSQPLHILVDDLSLLSFLFLSSSPGPASHSTLSRHNGSMMDFISGLQSLLGPGGHLLAGTTPSPSGRAEAEEGEGEAEALSLACVSPVPGEEWLSLLRRRADTIVQVRPLASGYSKDITGELVVSRMHDGLRAPSHSRFHYRLGETGVRCATRG